MSQRAFGPYRILSLLGEGGSGQVFRARDPRLERDVALKILRERPVIDPERVRRFVAEARAASTLNHPNIVTVFDAAVDGDTPFIVSELIDGGPLRDELNRGPLPLKRILDLATQITDGLSAAHEAGIVHRDLKPENIMVTRTGRVKILDFGLARPGGFGSAGNNAATSVQTEDGQTQTELGLLVGTVPYMSPEQARGTATDFHSDQFSFGLILHEMVTGQCAFRRATPAATLDAIINDEPDLATLTGRAPVLLRWIIERCLAKEPHERYGVTRDLHRDLKTLRDRLAEAVSLETLQPSGARWTIGKRAIGAAVVLAALGAGVLIPALVNEPRSIDAGALRFTPLATEAGYEGSPAWSPDGQTIAYVAEVNGVLQIFTRRLSSPASTGQVTHAAYDCKYPFWSPDSKRIYYVSLARDRDGLWSVGAAGGTPQVVVEDAVRGAISPDGRTIAFLRDEQPGDIVGAAALWLSTPAVAEPWPTGAVQTAAKRYEAFRALPFVEGALAFSPDGQKIGLTVVTRSVSVRPEERGWQVWVLPLPRGEPYRRLQWWADPMPRVTNFVWLPDSRHIVIGIASLTTPGSDLWIADLIADRAWPITRGPDSEYDPSASPAGDQVVFTRDESNYDLLEVPPSGGLARPLLATSRSEADPAWSPDGSQFAYVTDRNGLEEIWLRSREGTRWLDRPLVTNEDFGESDRTIMLSSPSFSPDGQRIAYQRNATPIWPLRIWVSLTAGGEPVPLLPAAHEGYQSAPTWSSDGQWIAYTEWKGRQWTLAKVRVGSGEAPIVLRTDGVPNATPRWSPKGDWITWETAQGFVLVSPDAKQEQTLAADQWLVHTWSRDGTAVIGIVDTEELRLSLVSVEIKTGRRRVLADLGPTPPVNNPVRGFSLRADGGAMLTSIARLRGDLWLLHGLRLPHRSWPWWPFRSP